MCRYWDEEDTWFYLEVDGEGWVVRQVELEGPELTPVEAASLAEWQRACDAGAPQDDQAPESAGEADGAHSQGGT